MALPIPELITLDIVKTLKGIRTAAGYSFTISDVERAKTPDNVPAAWKAIVGVGNPTEIARTYPLITMHLNYDVGIWIQVNEASGANCTTTPGDGTFNHSTATNNQTQRYDIDESTIPDGATVTSAVVRVCAQRGGASNVNFVMRFCVNGTCTEPPAIPPPSPGRIFQAPRISPMT